MSIPKKIKKALKDPYKIIAYLNRTPVMKVIPDDLCVKCLYRSELGKKLDLNHPVGFNEKLQWLKLYDHKDEYTLMVDKLSVKRYVADKIGEEHVIPLLGVWERADDVDISQLPDQFVLKTNHDSKGIVICKDKDTFDLEGARAFLQKHLDYNFYYGGREWPYKNVKPRIIAEKYMEDLADGELRDYKFFCFNGVPKVLYISQNRFFQEETVADFFDMDFQHLDIRMDHEMAETLPEKPKNFELMKELAEKLSAGIPQVRVDFYEADGRVYFGELTFFHCSGFAPFRPEKWDKVFGDWIDLPPKTR